MSDMEWIVVVVMFIALTWVFGRIMWKATGHAWLGLFWLIPGVNLIVLVYAAVCAVPDLPHTQPTARASSAPAEKGTWTPI